MKLRSMLAGTALAALALVAAAEVGAPGIVVPAAAAVDLSFNVFYDQLGQYGDWVRYDNDYVFIPGQMRDGWRPYTQGHWVYTKRYGWTWASDEPFGWATYHYGRWGYAEDIGWYWVPGKRWAPAWVSWRRSNDYVVWAPLPPSRHGGGIDVSINVNVGDIPDYYWVAVPTRRFLAPDLRVDIVNDDQRIRQVVHETRYIGTPRVTNNIVVNNVIDVNVIARETGERVRAVDVQTTSDPAEAKAGADRVTAFQGTIATDSNARPQKLSDVSKVRKITRTDAKGGPSTDQQNGPAGGGGTGATTNAGTGTSGNANMPSSSEATTAPPTGKDKKKIDTGSNANTGQSAPSANEATTMPNIGRKKNVDTGSNANIDQSAPSANEASTPATNGKRKKTVGTGQNAAPSGSGENAAEAQDQQPGRKHRKLQGSSDQNGDATGSTSQAPAVMRGNGKPGNGSDQNGNANSPAGADGKARGKKDQGCDPNTQSCAPAQ